MESAKRRVPAVKPVVHNGKRYEPLRRPREQGFKQDGGVIAAIDEASGAQLWAVQLYEIVFDANEERDVQEVYVNSLRIDSKNGRLIATDELKRRWQIKLTDGHVTQLPAAESRK